jgi:hypothetical protein
VITVTEMSDGELLAELAARLGQAALGQGETGLRLREATVEDLATDEPPVDRPRRSGSR